VGKEQQRTLVAFNSRSPTFNTSFEFFKVAAAQELEVQVRARAGLAAWGQGGQGGCRRSAELSRPTCLY
jgi:hypothetical protein